ncbi:MAG TPA: DUF1761 domain-containing protein [Terracidiphilus sp.]|nr:DUF1761 domain-containing protein [Terracidiphilus sp.]
MLQLHHHLNQLSIFASALILWILGAIWYSPPLFSKPWMKLLGFDKYVPHKNTLVPGMMASFVCDFILSFVLANFIIWTGADTFAWGALTGLIIWIGFFVAPNLPQSIYENRPFRLFAINNGYWLVGLPLVGGVIAIWR